MQAEVKSISSPDIDLEAYYPPDGNCFMFLIEFVVGIRGKEGGDIFSIEVCTPEWLQQNYGEDESLFPRGKLIVFSYNVDRFIKRIKNYCESCHGNKWEEIALKISRIAHWEFEDYQAR